MSITSAIASFPTDTDNPLNNTSDAMCDEVVHEAMLRLAYDYKMEWVTSQEKK